MLGKLHKGVSLIPRTGSRAAPLSPLLLNTAASWLMDVQEISPKLSLGSSEVVPEILEPLNFWSYVEFEQK